jgi:16S rRNA (uracil1498-N3)-methyltransferase
MPISRIFQDNVLSPDTSLILTEAASHHLARVLRASIGDEVTVFNGQGGEYHCVIERIDKKNVTLQVKTFSAREAESSLELYLAQGISRGEKMDYTIQKAVELGVKKIIPLLTERCNVKLDDERREKRLQHWQAIVISACEQCGRNQIPEILLPITFERWVQSVDADWRFVLSPHVSGKLSENQISENARVVLLIGPEGGLSDKEVNLAFQKNFLPLNLGPRILRTETAAVAAITALQCFFGDIVK